VAGQSLAGFYAVVTNRRCVTAPKSSKDAIAAIESFLSMPGLSLLPQPMDVVVRWCELLRRRPVTGGDVFDLQLIATMLAGGVKTLYTFNVSDFKPFMEIKVLTPAK
jgi:predicted nucleic acid-binding protein